MQALFGSGHHPLAEQRAARLPTAADATEQDVLDAIRLGQPFKVYSNDISPFRIEVARRLEALNVANGLPAKAAAAIEDRARIRTEVAVEMFRDEYRTGTRWISGSSPVTSRDCHGSRPPRWPGST